LAPQIYDDGQLYKTVTIDEAGNAVVEYKDKEGRVILKKVQIGTIASDFSGYRGFLCTCYIYDDLNQLRTVIQPKAVAAMITAGNRTIKDQEMFDKTLDYIHQNPVVAGFVTKPEDWKYSSARDFCGSDSYRRKGIG
jgi:hypothetical protein